MDVKPRTTLMLVSNFFYDDTDAHYRYEGPLTPTACSIIIVKLLLSVLNSSLIINCNSFRDLINKVFNSVRRVPNQKPLPYSEKQRFLFHINKILIK